MIRKYIFLILFSFIYSNSPVNNFIIGFWPEYDHPGVLVSIQVESNLNNLPFEFILFVPKNAKSTKHIYLYQKSPLQNHFLCLMDLQF